MKQAFPWVAVIWTAAIVLIAQGLTAQSLAPLNEKGVPVGALAPEAIAKSRPKAAFDITGTWLHGRPEQPVAVRSSSCRQAHAGGAGTIRRGQESRREGKAYHDDIGECWPAGLPTS